MPRKILATFAALLCTGSVSAIDLQSAYDKAKSGDPQLKSAAAARDSADAGINISRAQLLPQLNASANVSRSNAESERNQAFQENGELVIRPVPSTSDTDGRGVDVNLSQSIYDHANYARLRAARANAARAEAQYRGAEQQLIIRVAEAYFNALTAEDSVRFARSDEKAVGRQLDQAEQRFNVGLTAITDVHEARARRDSATAAAILAENALDDARQALAEITGEYAEALNPLRTNIPLEPPQPNVWSEWVNAAMNANPEVLAAMRGSDAADQQIAAARSGHYPTLTLNGRYSDSTDDTNTLLLGNRTSTTNPFTSDSVSLTLNVPLFSGFAVSSRVKQAVADHQGSLDSLEQTRRSVTRQTRNAFRSVIAGISEVKAREQALISAQSALDATQAGFEVGTRTIVDVLLSQQVLVQAQRDYSRARHEFVVNGLRLKRAAGSVAGRDVAEINALLVPPTAP